MAVLTVATTPSAQGIIKVFTFASVDDGDTFVGPDGSKGFWVQSTADPTTNTSAGVNVAHSGGTYTFYPGVDSLTCTLFVVA